MSGTGGQQQSRGSRGSQRTNPGNRRDSPPSGGGSGSYEGYSGGRGRRTTRTSPNSRRSPRGPQSLNGPVLRNTTLRFVRPSNSRVTCAKWGHLEHTKFDHERGNSLCENYLNGRCSAGADCPSAHVQKQYLWEFLVPSTTGNPERYLPGFSIRCYNPEMTAYYEIPSEYAYVTKGSAEYVARFNENGDNSKEKYMLCPHLLHNTVCDASEKCDKIHCFAKNLSDFLRNRTHVATPDQVGQYETLPASITVRVYEPNTGGNGKDYRGDEVLRTVGAAQYEEAYRRDGAVPAVKMQHCAHFASKSLCRLGLDCRFLHVVPYALAAQEARELEAKKEDAHDDSSDAAEDWQQLPQQQEGETMEVETETTTGTGAGRGVREGNGEDSCRHSTSVAAAAADVTPPVGTGPYALSRAALNRASAIAVMDMLQESYAGTSAFVTSRSANAPNGSSFAHSATDAPAPSVPTTEPEIRPEQNRLPSTLRSPLSPPLPTIGSRQVESGRLSPTARRVSVPLSDPAVVANAEVVQVLGPRRGIAVSAKNSMTSAPQLMGAAAASVTGAANSAVLGSTTGATAPQRVSPTRRHNPYTLSPCDQPL